MPDPQYLQNAVASFQHFLQSSQVAEMQAIAGGVSTLQKALNKIETVGEAHLVKKLSTFALTAQRLGFDSKAYARLEQRHGKEKILEELVIILDRLSDTEKTKVLAYLMLALQEEKINWDEFRALSFVLEQLNPITLSIDIKRRYGDDGDLLSAATPYLMAAGVAYSFTPDTPLMWDGTTGETKFTLTPLGDKFIKLGIQPYQEGKQ